MSDIAISRCSLSFFKSFCCELSRSAGLRAKCALPKISAAGGGLRASYRYGEFEHSEHVALGKPVTTTTSDAALQLGEGLQEGHFATERATVNDSTTFSARLEGGETEQNELANHMDNQTIPLPHRVSDGNDYLRTGKLIADTPIAFTTRSNERDIDLWLRQGTHNESEKGKTLVPLTKEDGMVEEVILQQGRRREQEDLDTVLKLTARKQEEDLLRKAAGLLDNVTMVKRSKMLAKQLISRSSAMALGFVSQIWVNAGLRKVVAVEVRPSLFSGQVDAVVLSNVCKVGEFILVTDESALESEMILLGCETLVGYEIITEDGYSLGKVRDFSFNLNDGELLSLEFDSLGFSLVPSNLISTYWIDIEAVIKVSSDKIVVKELAESQVRRLTKGIWQMPNIQGKDRSRRRTSKSRRAKQGVSMSQDDIDTMSQKSSLAEPPPSVQTSRFPGKSNRDGPEIADLSDRWSPMDYTSSQHKH